MEKSHHQLHPVMISHSWIDTGVFLHSLLKAALRLTSVVTSANFFHMVMVLNITDLHTQCSGLFGSDQHEPWRCFYLTLKIILYSTSKVLHCKYFLPNNQLKSVDHDTEGAL